MGGRTWSLAMRFVPIVFAVHEIDGAALHADEPYGLPNYIETKSLSSSSLLSCHHSITPPPPKKKQFILS